MANIYQSTRHNIPEGSNYQQHRCDRFIFRNIKTISGKSSSQGSSEILKTFVLLQNLHVGRDSSVGIATRYRLDGPGIESRWGRDFPHPPTLALRPTQTPIQWVLGLFPGGGKAAGAWR
jgi:hypothetical protein